MDPITIFCGPETFITLRPEGITIVAPTIEITATEVNSVGSWTHEGDKIINGDHQVNGEHGTAGNKTIAGSEESATSTTGAAQAGDATQGATQAGDASAGAAENVNETTAAAENAAGVGGTDSRAVNSSIDCPTI